ncbi:undecaprenyldiphospho-muramoylpentapeptide beta-N-acetylglucosaminyltransferase [Membranicola marinus]|uniref:UDP-N-acetylglucosamine--N-acetylmuramyl-(pentapeptide) pyrophosphoryl-undecaprenol N-acetylglucosamine transferase n=1 Tax=Membranihabitans marinus TaxID=1227546 RepID=A0A953HSG6_9BACT|nr:undecaprenyldiphospho-muramoylpentapeptide beta-N-acetylglucosaminyltransferase [Membranihabitans marinus]MBY5957545.1 undecaprenyldiphospho-muramoylpentapeptide beta-N-acetylglucosaminyltransferase [Membranihabitans marinus]
MKIMISGGGTGGHIFPALAIADAINRLHPSANFLFVGAQGRMEMEKIPAAGYPIEGLWISGFDRQKMWRNFSFPFKLVSSLAKSYRLLKKFKPDAVVGVGGFASGPILEVAHRMGIPTLIQEQNSYPGVTNKLLARKVNRVCVAFEKMDAYFPNEKIVISGNPIRQSLLASNWSRTSARKDLGIAEDQKVVLALGGSLGARTLNQMFAQNTAAIEARPNIFYIWQYGALYEEEYSQSKTAQLPNVKAVKFIDDMARMYAASDLIVARAGALTLTELAALGKAALLIPSPNVAEDHQTKNARRLTESAAAGLLEDKNAVDGGIDRIQELVGQKEVLETYERNIKSFYRADAAERIATEVIKLAQEA